MPASSNLLQIESALHCTPRLVSSISVLDQTHAGVSPPEGRFQSIYHKLCTQVSCYQPADYSPRVDVEDEGQVEETLPGMDIGYPELPLQTLNREGKQSATTARKGIPPSTAASTSSRAI
jgi:hypothetical protein